METIYGVGVRNRFDLYGDEDDVEDPFEILKQKEAEIEKLKQEKTLKSSSKVPKHVQATGPKPKKEVAVNKVTSDIPVRGLDRLDKAKKQQSVGPYQDANVENILPEGRWKEEQRRGRGSSVSGRGTGRNRGQADGFDQRGKRQFDRQSGSNKSGVKGIEKKEGGGAHNWGSVEQSIHSAKLDISYEESGVYPNESSQAPDEQMPETSPAVKPKGDDDVAMTLDEWKEKEQYSRSIPTYNLRKPGEGEGDNKKWGNVYVLKKKDLDDDEEEDELEEDENMKRGRQKHHLDIEIRFGDMALHGKNRRRGGGRNKAVSSHDSLLPNPGESCAQKLSIPKVDDLNDFPSLSAT